MLFIKPNKTRSLSLPEIMPQDYPELWQTIRTLCRKISISPPDMVFVSPNVNVQISYSRNGFQSIFSSKKKLTIGIGLFAYLNTSEFNAVLTHEFGNFKYAIIRIFKFFQPSIKRIKDLKALIGSYGAYIDDFMHISKQFFYLYLGLKILTWPAKLAIAIFYFFINRLDKSINIELELTAGKLATQALENEAIYTAARKTETFSVIFEKILSFILNAAKADLYVKNIFYHFETEIKRSSQSLLQKPKNTSMDAPQALLPDLQLLQEDLSKLFYEYYLELSPGSVLEIQEFERLFSSQKKGDELLKHYHNIFILKQIKIPDIITLQSTSQNIVIFNRNIIEALKSELGEIILNLESIEKTITKARNIIQFKILERSLHYKNKLYRRKDLRKLINELSLTKQNILSKVIPFWQTKYFSVHDKLASKKKKSIQLNNLYQQHNRLIDFHHLLIKAKSDIEELTTEFYPSKIRLTFPHKSDCALKKQVLYITEELTKAHESLGESYFTPFQFIDNPQILRTFIANEDFCYFSIDDEYFKKKILLIHESLVQSSSAMNFLVIMEYRLGSSPCRTAASS